MRKNVFNLDPHLPELSYRGVRVFRIPIIVLRKYDKE